MTRDSIIAAAISEARRVGLAFITREGIAAIVGMPAGSIGAIATMDDIKRAALEADPGLAGPTDRYEAQRQNLNDRVLEAAIELALRGSYLRLTRHAVATEADVSAGTVSNYAGGMDGLKEAVLREAVKRPIPAIVAQGLAVSNPIALAAPLPVKEAAINTMRG